MAQFAEVRLLSPVGQSGAALLLSEGNPSLLRDYPRLIWITDNENRIQGTRRRVLGAPHSFCDNTEMYG